MLERLRNSKKNLKIGTGSSRPRRLLSRKYDDSDDNDDENIKANYIFFRVRGPNWVHCANLEYSVHQSYKGRLLQTSDVSVEHVAPTFRVPKKLRMHFNGLYGVSYQKI
jgi:hypothetical protein